MKNTLYNQYQEVPYGAQSVRTLVNTAATPP